MREPSIAVSLLQLVCRDEALVGDILEEYDARHSRAWLWRQVGAAIVFALPYGMVRRERHAPKMRMPIGGLGFVAVVFLITIVAPGAWWFVAFGALGGVAVAFLLAMTTRRRILRAPTGRHHVLVPLLLLMLGGASDARAGQALRPAGPVDPVDGIVEAFKSHEVVMLPGGHGSKRAHELLLQILRDPRIQGTVTDVVVEFGTSRYQDLIDRYIRGEEMSFATIKHAWQDTTIPGVTNDGPYVEDFYRSVRAINAPLPKGKRYRVLGGDPPMDWDNVVTKEDLRKWVVRRDTFPADVIRREVVERGRRALVVYGPAHFPRKDILVNYDMSDWQAQTMTSLLEKDGVRVFVIQLEGGAEMAGLQPDVTSWPAQVLVPVRGTPIGAADYAVINGGGDRYAIRGLEDFVKIPKEQYKAMRIEEVLDAILWNPVPGRNPILLSKETCADPAYLPMRLGRIAIAGLPQGEADAAKKACGVE